MVNGSIQTEGQNVQPRGWLEAQGGGQRPGEEVRSGRCGLSRVWGLGFALIRKGTV